MKKTIFTVIAVVLGFSASAQLYTVTTPFKGILKTTNHGILHEYIEITNLSGGNLPMRWVAQFGGPIETPSPSAWTYGVADPDSAYAVLNDNDSADFILPLANNNKIIISVNHNGMAGAYQINFKVFPLSNPNDSTIIGFPITVNQGGVGITSYGLESNNSVYPNPSNGIFTIEQKFDLAILYNAVGEEVKAIQSDKVDLSAHPNGVYFLQLTNRDGIISRSRLIKQ